MDLVVKQLTFPHVVSSIYAKFLLDQPTLITALRFEVIFSVLEGTTLEEVKRLHCGEPIACISTVDNKKLVILTKLNNVFTVEYDFHKNEFSVSPSLHLSSPYHLDDWFGESQVNHEMRLKATFGSCQFMESDKDIVAIHTFDGLLSVFSADLQKHLVIPLKYSNVYQLKILPDYEDGDTKYLAIVTRDMDLNYLIQVFAIQPNCEDYTMHKQYHVADVPSLMVALPRGYIYCICDTQHYLFPKNRVNLTVSDHIGSVKKYRGFVSLTLPYSVRYKKATAFTKVDSRQFIFCDSSMGLHSVELRMKADRVSKWTVTTLRTNFQAFSSIISLGNKLLFGSGGSSPPHVFQVDCPSVEERVLPLTSSSGNVFSRCLGDHQLSDICSIDTEWNIETISESHLNESYKAVEARKHIFLFNKKWSAFENDLVKVIHESLVKFSEEYMVTAEGCELCVYRESELVLAKTMRVPISAIAISGDVVAVANETRVEVFSLGSPEDCRTIKLKTDVFAIAIMEDITLISDKNGHLYIYRDSECILKRSAAPMRLELISVSPQIQFIGVSDTCSLFVHDGVDLVDKVIAENAVDAALFKGTVLVLKKDALLRFRLKASFRITPRTSHECMVKKVLLMDSYIVALCVKEEINAETSEFEYTSWVCLIDRKSVNVLESVIVGEGGTEIVDSYIFLRDLFLLTMDHTSGTLRVESLSIKEGNIESKFQCELPTSAEFSHIFINNGHLMLSGKSIRWFRIEEEEVVPVTACFIKAPYYFSLCVPFSEYGLLLYDLVHGLYSTKADPYMMVTNPLKLLFKPNAVVTALKAIGQDTFALGDCVGNVEIFRVKDTLERVSSLNVSEFTISSIELLCGSIFVGTSVGEVFTLVLSHGELKADFSRQKATIDGWRFIDDDVHVEEMDKVLSPEYASTSYNFQQMFYPNYLIGGSSDTSTPSDVAVLFDGGG